MKRHSIFSTISCVTLLMLPIVTASCGSDSGDDLFGSGKPNPDAGSTGGRSGKGGSSGASGTGAAGTAGVGTGGSGARSSGGTTGSADASAGTSGTGAGATSGRSGASGANGTGGSSAGSGGTIGTGGSGATDASAGTAGSTGSGGSAGTNGSAGSAGDAGDASGGTSGVDAGPDAGPTPCDNNNSCKNDEFCSKPSCAAPTGECKPRPKICAANESPVCGCDAVNYWNDCLRQLVGTAASTSGECPTPATCGGLVGKVCPTQRARCAHLLTTQLQCGVSDAFGECWVIPEQCPQIVAGSTHRPCSGPDRCVSKCEAIKTEHDFFADASCPQ